MSEIVRPEDSVFFRSWGIVSNSPEVIYQAPTDIDLCTVGKLPAQQWLIPEANDWDLMDALLEIEDMSENVPPVDWGVVRDPIISVKESEIIEIDQPSEEIARVSATSLNVSRYLVFNLNASDIDASS